MCLSDPKPAAPLDSVDAEVSRLNGLIADEEIRQKQLSDSVGKLYVQLHHDDYEPAFAEYMSEFLASEDAVRGFRTDIDTARGIRRCACCGAEVELTAAFCSGCGARMPRADQAIPEGFLRCENCGNLLRSDMRFCTQCGHPVIRRTDKSTETADLPAEPAVPQKPAEEEIRPAREEVRNAIPPLEPAVAEKPPVYEIPPIPTPEAKPAEKPAPVKCPACGAPVNGGMSFCTECGQPLTDAELEAKPAAVPEVKVETPEPTGFVSQATCPKCGAAVDAGTRFCTSCGAAMPGEKKKSRLKFF